MLSLLKMKLPLPTMTIHIILISQIISKFQPGQLIEWPSSTFVLLSTPWPPNRYRGDYGSHLPSSSRGGGTAHHRTTPNFFASVTLDPVLYLPEFPLEQGEHKKLDLKHLHVLQHKSTSVINVPISMPRWIFNFNIAENLYFTSTSQHIRNVIC